MTFKWIDEKLNAGYGSIKTVMIVEFDATLDDVVDVSMRSLARSKTVRAWSWQGLLTNALLSAVLMFAILPASFGTRLFFAIVVAFITAGIYLWTYKGRIEKRMRKLCMEQIGPNSPFPVRVELSESNIKVTSQKTEYLHDWSAFAEVEESGDAIYFWKRDGGGFAVRRRGFASESDKDQLLKDARRLVQAARTES